MRPADSGANWTARGMHAPASGMRPRRPRHGVRLLLLVLGLAALVYLADAVWHIAQRVGRGPHALAHTPGALPMLGAAGVPLWADAAGAGALAVLLVASLWAVGGLIREGSARIRGATRPAVQPVLRHRSLPLEMPASAASTVLLLPAARAPRDADDLAPPDPVAALSVPDEIDVSDMIDVSALPDEGTRDTPVSAAANPSVASKASASDDDQAMTAPTVEPSDGGVPASVPATIAPGLGDPADEPAAATAYTPQVFISHSSGENADDVWLADDLREASGDEDGEWGEPDSIEVPESGEDADSSPISFVDGS